MEKIELIIFDWIGTLYQFGGKGLFPYSEEVLKELKPKYSLAVISKATSDNVENRLRQIEEIADYFDFIIADIDKNPAQFIECMRTLGAKPEVTLAVDDRADRGIQIANSLGCKTAWIKEGKYSYIRPTKSTGFPTFVINSIKDLPLII